MKMPVLSNLLEKRETRDQWTKDNGVQERDHSNYFHRCCFSCTHHVAKNRCGLCKEETGATFSTYTPSRYIYNNPPGRCKTCKRFDPSMGQEEFEKMLEHGEYQFYASIGFSHSKIQERLRGFRKMQDRQTQHDITLEKMHLRPASESDYQHWLSGFAANGGKVTNSYDYPFSRQADRFFIATKNFTTEPAYGSGSMQIIVPEHVKCLGGDFGHSTMYFMDGFRREGHFVPSFTDMKP